MTLLGVPGHDGRIPGHKVGICVREVAGVLGKGFFQRCDGLGVLADYVDNIPISNGPGLLKPRRGRGIQPVNPSN